MFIILSSLAVFNIILGIINAQMSHVSSYNFYASYFNFFVAGFLTAAAIDLFARGF